MRANQATVIFNNSFEAVEEDVRDTLSVMNTRNAESVAINKIFDRFTDDDYETTIAMLSPKPNMADLQSKYASTMETPV